MNESIREITSKGDPMLRVSLPQALITALKAMAKKNKRRPQDEFIKRLNLSFNFDEEFNLAQAELLKQEALQQDLSSYAQVISLEMFQALTEAAKKKGLSLNQEVGSRLLATLQDPKNFNLDTLSAAILHYKFLHKEALSECNWNRKAALYRYEMEKLRLFLIFEPKLPRHTKEKFSLIDVKKARKFVEQELKELAELEAKANKQAGLE